MNEKQFLKQEAKTRAIYEYGLYPYEPELPCKTVKSSMRYKCNCGFKTTSSKEIWRHKCNDTSNTTD